MQNRRFRSATILLPLTCAALVAACDDPSSPELVETWALESMFGQEPPFPLYERADPDEPGVTCVHVFVSSEIELRTERRFEMTDAIAETCGGGEPRPYTERRGGTWQLDGDSLFLDIESDDPILPNAPLDGRIDGDRLLFEYEVYTEAGGVDTTAIVYRRVTFGTAAP